MPAKFSCELYAHEYNSRGASPASKAAGHAEEAFFCDCLALRPNLAAEYEQLKLALWKSYERDRDGCTAARSDFVRRVTAEAKRYFETQK